MDLLAVNAADDAAEPDDASMEVVFSTGAVHARDRLDYWRSEASKVFVEHDFDTAVGRAFRGILRATSIGKLGLASFESDEATVHYTDRCVRHAASDDFFICRQITGGAVLHQDGRSVLPKIGDLWLIDPRRPFSIDVQPDSLSLAIKAPRDELEARLGDISGLTARPISGEQPVVSLASGFFDMLAQRAGAIDEPAAGKLAQQALDLLALAIKSELHEGSHSVSSPRSVTLLRLKAVIEERLRDPALKPASAAAAAGISVRYANALLAEEGTSLERHIMNRRLENCHRELSALPSVSRTVSDVAYAWGFSDLSHFTRRFKARFGCSPGECRLRTGKVQA